jgi:hypothetical protein
LYRVILLGLLPCNRLGTCPLDYIKEGRVPSRAPDLNQHQAQGAILDLQTGRRVHHLGNPNLYKSCVPCPCTYLRVLGLPITILHSIIYYLRYPLGRFAGLNHRQLAHQVGVIITTGRIRRTLVNKINILVDSLRSIEASRLAPVKAESIRLRRASGCLGSSHGSSRGSSSTTSPRAGSSLTTSPTSCVLVPRHVAWLVVDYFTSRGSSSTTSPHAGSSSTTSPTARVRVPRHITRLVTRLVAPLVIDYFAYAARPGASTRRAARHAARRRLLHLAQARRRLLRLRRASGCLGTSRGSSRGSSSTTSPPLRVQVPRHVARLVVDYFDYAARPVASARRAARHAARHRLLRLRRASGCLGRSRGSSHKLVVDYLRTMCGSRTGGWSHLCVMSD